MHLIRRRNVYKYVSEFDSGRIVDYREYGSSFLDIVTRIGPNPTTVIKIWNRRVLEGRTERHAGYQRLPLTPERTDTCRQVGLAGSYKNITDPESGNELVCSAASIRTNSATTFGTVRTFCTVTIIAAFFDAATRRHASTVVRSTTKLDTGVAPRHAYVLWSDLSSWRGVSTAMVRASPIGSKRTHYRCDDCQTDFYKYKSLVVHRSTCRSKLSQTAPASAKSSFDSAPLTEPPQKVSSPVEREPLPTDPQALVAAFEAAMLRKKKAIEFASDAAMEANYLADVTKQIKFRRESALKTLREAESKLNLLNASNAPESEQSVAKKRLVRASCVVQKLSVREKYAIASLEEKAVAQRKAMEKAVEASTIEQSAFKAAAAALLLQQGKEPH